MAKQTGDMVFIGTYNGLCFYCMNGKYYVRASNPLSRKRVLTDAAFAGTRRYAQWLAEASPIAAAIYRSVPVEKRQKGLYRTITGKALLLLKAGVAGAEVKALLTHEVAMMVKQASKSATRPQPEKTVYNRKPGIPFPQWPGVRMIAVRKTINNTRLRRRRQLQASTKKRRPFTEAPAGEGDCFHVQRCICLRLHYRQKGQDLPAIHMTLP